MWGDELVATAAAEERLLWLAALAFYGIGDSVTTLVGLAAGEVAEAGPVAGTVIDGVGTPGFLALKLVTLCGFYGLWSILRTAGRVAVPLALAVVGVVVTTWNVVVIVATFGV